MFSRPPRLRIRPFCRYNSKVSEAQNCQNYLAYCKSKDVSVTSTVFRGTLYELVVKSYLEQIFHCEHLIRNGGAYDQGVDIFGKWNLEKYYHNARKKVHKMSVLYNCIEYRNNHRLPVTKQTYALDQSNILVQCKNHDKKMTAATIRELSGVFNHKIRRKAEKTRTFAFLVSPYPLTEQAQMEVDTSSHSIVHLKIAPKELIPSAEDPYDLNNWQGDKLHSIYLNKFARHTLQGLDIEVQLREALQNANHTKTDHEFGLISCQPDQPLIRTKKT